MNYKNSIFFLSALFIFIGVPYITHAIHPKQQQATQQDGKRRLSKQEITFLTAKVDSIKRNLNRMIRFEKELMQRNYYLNEKTALVDELIATVQYLQHAVDVIAITDTDIKKIFGKSKAKIPGKLIYEIETYQSNCPFMAITFNTKEQLITRVEYEITDCQRWK